MVDNDVNAMIEASAKLKLYAGVEEGGGGREKDADRQRKREV